MWLHLTSMYTTLVCDRYDSLFEEVLGKNGSIK